MEDRESQHEASSEVFEANQQEEDIDASLFCPDVILDERTDSISIDKNEHVENYMDADPLDYNIIGIKAHFQLTDEEESLRLKRYNRAPYSIPIQATKLHCTSCNCHLGSALNNIKNVYVHPLLSVLICKECFDFYTVGDFELDEDGQEKFCRWCGQGGKLFCCNECPRGFCTTCVQFNFSSTRYYQIRNAHYWKCFICNPSSIMHLKVKCFQFAKYVCKELTRIENIPKNDVYMDIDYSPCCASRSPKRKLEKDPDFIPDNYDEVKSAKQVKSIKKRDEWETGQIPNNEYTQNLRNLGESVLSTSWCQDKEDRRKAPFLDRKAGSVLPIAKTVPSITSSTVKLNKAPTILLQSKTGNVNMFLNIPKNIVLPYTSGNLYAVPKTVALKPTFTSTKPIFIQSKMSSTPSTTTSMLLASTKTSSYLTAVPKTVFTVPKTVFTVPKTVFTVPKTVFTAPKTVLKNNFVVTKPTIPVTKSTITSITVPSKNQSAPLHFAKLPLFTPISDYPWIPLSNDAINENGSVLKYTNQQQNITVPDKMRTVNTFMVDNVKNGSKYVSLLTCFLAGLCVNLIVNFE
uniref:Uncharacterized protein LOC114329904 isoform X1 n=1 Tax=Diabrotica virgifera virgifera TaxID=50390 RepID=A0A6P7FPN3_DIAVI